MNPNTFTYQGQTVSYTEDQKAIVIADQNLITQLQANLRNYQARYSQLETIINDAIAKTQSGGYCDSLSKFGSPSPKSQCHTQYNNIWDSARAEQGTIANTIYPTINTQIASATKKLNDDITTIENDLKLQIQTQLANAAAEAAAANAQTTVNNAPAVIAANSAAAQLQLANDAAAAKLKQEQNIKVAGFVLIAVVVIAIGFFVVRRVS